MFRAKTERIAKIAEKNREVIEQLEALLVGNVHMYIDYANVRPWADKLGWHIDLKRLKQFLESFDNIKSIKFYAGTLTGDRQSEQQMEQIRSLKYDLRTKPVKIMQISIDTTSIEKQSTALVKNFIRSSLIRLYDVATIEMLNRKFADFNARGQYFIEDRKCNFDVEIGRDMLVDFDKEAPDTFVLWSGDSDFENPLRQLIADGKKVRLFATARRVSSELNKLQPLGLFVFDIQKIKEFICWGKELDGKRDPREEAPKL